MRHGHESREGTDKVTTSRRRAEQRGLDYTEVVEREVKDDWDIVYIREPNGFFHKLKAAYVRHAKAIGDDTRVVTQSHEAYRLSFATAFRTTMVERFWQMQLDAEAEMDTIPGAALAIRDMKQEADEAMWADFPNLSPEEIARRQEAMRAQAEAAAKAREEMLDAMSTKERQKFLEEEEAQARAEARRQRSWERKNTRYYSRDRSATERGTAAARAVDLSRKAGSAGASGKRGELA